MSRERRWRVVSDGIRTRVDLDGVDVSNTVRAVSFMHPSPREAAWVTLEVRGIDVDLDVTVPEADLDVDEDPLRHPIYPTCGGCPHEPHGLDACPECGCEWIPS